MKIIDKTSDLFSLDMKIEVIPTQEKAFVLKANIKFHDCDFKKYIYSHEYLDNYYLREGVLTSFCISFLPEFIFVDQDVHLRLDRFIDGDELRIPLYTKKQSEKRLFLAHKKIMKILSKCEKKYHSIKEFSDKYNRVKKI